MLTAWCMAVAFATPFLVGGPLVWLARRGGALRSTDWLWVPFVGIAASICILQNLAVFADLPVKRTAPWLWLGVGLLWIPLLASRGGRASFRLFPLRIILLMIAVGSLHGIGVWQQGVERYRGCMQSDQYQYAVLAQFISDEPISTGWPAAREHPWLVQPVALKEDRLGQSVLHSFFTVTAGRDAFDLYFPTQLLGAALLCPAMLLLAAQFRLSRRVALWGALAAALAPGTELLQSFCYLSHALCMPVLVAFLAAVIRLSRGGGLRPLAPAAVCFTLGLASYTEFVPLLLGAGAAALCAGWLAGLTTFRRGIGVGAAVVLLGTCANPAAVLGAFAVFQRGMTAGPQMTLPNSLATWVACLWVNSNAAVARVFGNGVPVTAVFVVGCFAAAAGGAMVLAGRAIRCPSLLPGAAATGSLLIPPVVLWVLRPDSNYVIAKLVWTLTPFFVLWMACGVQALRGRLAVGRRSCAFVASWSLVVVFAYQDYQEQKNFLSQNMARAELARAWNGPDLRGVCDELHRRPPGDVVVALDGDPKPELVSAAVCYHGRHHRIRLVAPDLIWLAKLSDVPGYGSPKYDSVEPGMMVVQRVHAPRLTGVKVEVLAQSGQYELLRVLEKQALTSRNRSSVTRRAGN